jgi:hypothetical protein
MHNSVRNARHAAQFIERLFINYFFLCSLGVPQTHGRLQDKRSLPHTYGNPNPNFRVLF